jgi:peptidoglycan hydrolase-like protein with peptidoglycan-binding domain
MPHWTSLILAGTIGLLLGMPEGKASGQPDPQIVTVQSVLREERLYPGKLSGVLDVETQSGIRHYQIVHGLRVTGQLDSRTRVAMHLPERTVPENLFEQDRKFLSALAPAPLPAIAEASALKEQEAPSPPGSEAPPPLQPSQPATHRNSKARTHQAGRKRVSSVD